jgi:Helix-turn-helix domain
VVPSELSFNHCENEFYMAAEALRAARQAVARKPKRDPKLDRLRPRDTQSELFRRLDRIEELLAEQQQAHQQDHAPRGPPEDETLTVSVIMAGKLLGLGRTAAYAAARNGAIPTIKINGRILVPRKALMELLETRVKALEV